jgi:prophage regulatory protein
MSTTADHAVILRRPEVQRKTGYSRSTIYLRITQRLWTRPVRLGARIVGWPAHEVAALNEARIAGCSNAQISSLVANLEAARALSNPLTRNSQEAPQDDPSVQAVP